MTLKQIEYFLKVCELKQISECSEYFGISQSAMSIAIKNLEKSLGGNLFDRKGKSITINERGKAFLHSITPIYNKVLDIEKNMRNTDIIDIYIAASQNIGNYLLPTLLKDLIQNSPNANLSVKIKNTESIIQSIKNNICDMGLIEDNIKDKEFGCMEICKDELIVVTANKELAKKKYTPKELCAQSWIIREEGSGTRNALVKNLPKKSNLNVILELNSTEAIKRSIKNTDFFTCLPKFTLKGEINEELFKVDVGDLKFNRCLNLVYPKDKISNCSFIKIANYVVKKISNKHKELIL